jgi:hypothetical protein
MNVNGFTRWLGRYLSTRDRLLGLIVAVLAGSAPGPAHAAAVKKHIITPANERVFVAWTHYLSAGPQRWSTKHAPPFTPAIQSTIWQILKTDTQGQSLANPMIDYLLWRRGLDPKRFTANHTRLSPALAQLLSAPSTPAGVPPPTYTPVPQATTTPTTTPITTAPQTATAPQTVSDPPLVPPSPQVAPVAVPEPGSYVIAAVMIGCGLWCRRRLRGPAII